MTDALYELRDVTKHYDGRLVLDIAHLQVLPGEVLAIVGPSGAGKSTLLRLMNFLEGPNGGTIAFNGRYLGQGDKMPLEIRRQVTTVFQRPILLNRSVEANVAYGLRLRGKRHVTKEVNEALEQVGLAALAKARARNLSGGEAQRIALARALVIRPDVLLLDEPTANLDPYNVAEIERIVREANRVQGTTIVLVTHNVFQARRLAHRVGFLLEGRLVEVADVETFFEAPTDARTRAFVNGEMVY